MIHLFSFVKRSLHLDEDMVERTVDDAAVDLDLLPNGRLDTSFDSLGSEKKLFDSVRCSMSFLLYSFASHLKYCAESNDMYTSHFASYLSLYLQFSRSIFLLMHLVVIHINSHYLLYVFLETSIC